MYIHVYVTVPYVLSDCGSKHHIQNGYVDFKDADTTMKAPVVCNSGYSAKTYGEIYCQADGTWLTETCEPKGTSV